MGAGYPAVVGQASTFQFPTGPGLGVAVGRWGRESYLGSSEAGSVALATDSRLPALPGDVMGARAGQWALFWIPFPQTLLPSLFHGLGRDA